MVYLYSSIHCEVQAQVSTGSQLVGIGDNYFKGLEIGRLSGGQ